MAQASALRGFTWLSQGAHLLQLLCPSSVHDRRIVCASRKACLRVGLAMKCTLYVSVSIALLLALRVGIFAVLAPDASQCPGHTRHSVNVYWVGVWEDDL